MIAKKFHGTEELTDEFFRATVVESTPIDTSRAVIPASRSLAQIAADEMRYHVSTATAQLRIELRAEIERARATSDELTRELEAAQKQHIELDQECRAVREARVMLDREITGARIERENTRHLYQRMCAASGLCTPSRMTITGR